MRSAVYQEILKCSSFEHLNWRVSSLSYHKCYWLLLEKSSYSKPLQKKDPGPIFTNRWMISFISDYALAVHQMRCFCLHSSRISGPSSWGMTTYQLVKACAYSCQSWQLRNSDSKRDSFPLDCLHKHCFSDHLKWTLTYCSL